MNLIKNEEKYYKKRLLEKNEKVKKKIHNNNHIFQKFSELFENYKKKLNI
jgi:hypothetical protein